MKTEIMIIVRKPGRQAKVHLMRTVKTKHFEEIRNRINYVFDVERKNRKIRANHPKKRSKLRRFFHRLWLTYRHRINVMCDAIVGTPSAADCELIVWEEKA